MIAIKRLKDLTGPELDRLFNRFGEDFSSIMVNTVAPIVRDVKDNGDDAVRRYTEKFDGVRLDSILATQKEIDEGHSRISREVLESFREARKNIEEFHRHQVRDNFIYARDDGTTLGMMYQPIESAAMYVPGGKASYPSSVLMGVIPARIAGCKKISVITPPDKNGHVPDVILAVCRELDVETIIKAGGAQGIAAAGLGTRTVPKAQIIVGPGNIYVTAAKTYLFSMGVIQIDSLAGPSEVLIIADDAANPEWVAWDLLSQAEHEEMAIAILVVTSQELAEKVRDFITEDIESGRGRHMIKKTSITRSGLIIVADNLDEAIAFNNSYGPEHMEFMVRNPLEYIHRIQNVGSLFLGDHAPVAVGDYYSGTNHILPTGGAARFSSGTSVETFLRRTTFQLLARESLRKAVNPVSIMSGTEGFDDKHGGSVRLRFKNEK